MRLVQGISQAGDDPADSLDVGRLLEVSPVRPIRVRAGTVPLRVNLVDDFEKVTAPAVFRGNLEQCCQNPRQARPPEVGHAERSEPAVGKRLFREQWDDVRVLQPRQREMFVVIKSTDFQDNQSVGQSWLLRQVGLSRRTATQLSNQAERAEHLADLGKHGGVGKRPQQAITVEEDLELFLPLRVPARDLGRRHILARFATETDLLVDQADGGLDIQVGELLQQIVRGDRAAAAQASAISRTWCETQALSEPDWLAGDTRSTLDRRPRVPCEFRGGAGTWVNPLPRAVRGGARSPSRNGQPSRQVIEDAPDASLVQTRPRGDLGQRKSLPLQLQDLAVARRALFQHPLPEFVPLGDLAGPRLDRPGAVHGA